MSRRFVSTDSGIACQHFNETEINALKSLLALLKPHLRRPWRVSTVGESRLVLVNLDADHDHDPAIDGRRFVGCAQRPRDHAPGTLYRPLRAAQVLSLLRRSEEQRAGNGHGRAGGERYRLRAWPLDWNQWPQRHWPILAALSRQHRSTDEVTMATGIPFEQVEHCLMRLAGVGLVDRCADGPADVGMARVGRWRSLSERIGRLLGFAR